MAGNSFVLGVLNIENNTVPEFSYRGMATASNSMKSSAPLEGIDDGVQLISRKKYDDRKLFNEWKIETNFKAGTLFIFMYLLLIMRETDLHYKVMETK